MIDYSKPVGWWCPKVQHAITADEGPCRWCIPVYTPLPVPEPCVIDDLGEVVTAEFIAPWALHMSIDATADAEGVPDYSEAIIADHVELARDINRIARASAKLKGKR